MTASDGFELHPRLRADSIGLAEWPLSKVLLMNDSRFPWLILVPKRAGIGELHELEIADRALLIEEANRASALLKSRLRADKINIGALGNIVPQLHLHVVARFATDAAWPGPVWGSGAAVPYRHEEMAGLRARLGFDGTAGL